ncbi:MAG: site-specific integrase [Bacteroidales bacterium]|nr:site-specific integrase [Bacteroidales bacterium]
MNTVSIHFELSSKKNKEGFYNVMLRLSSNRKLKRIATKVFTLERDFQSKYGKWIKSTIGSNYENKNIDLTSWFKKAANASSALEKKGIPLTLENIADYIKGKDDEINFTEYAEKVAKRFKDSGQVSSYIKYNNNIEKLKKYVGNKNLKFNDISVTFLINFEIHLKKLGNGVSTIEKEFKIIRAILYRAIREGLFEQERNPFFQFKLKSEKTSRMKLNEDEIMKIENLQLTENTPIWHTRNYWLFSFYTAGVRFSDLCMLKWESIRNDRLVYKMNKTAKEKSIKLFPKTKAILAYYDREDKKNEDFIFPILDLKYDYSDKFFLHRQISSKDVMINKNLKTIATMCEIKTPLSFHISRHSFAYIARKSGKMDIYQISKMLGHSDIKVSERYFGGFDELTASDDAMGNVLGY